MKKLLHNIFLNDKFILCVILLNSCIIYMQVAGYQCFSTLTRKYMKTTYSRISSFGLFEGGENVFAGSPWSGGDKVNK